MFNYSLDFLHRAREDRISLSLQPSRIRHDDLYLVEYPKSGVTYLCHLLACMEFNSENVEVNFFNLHTYVPDIHEGVNVSDHFGKNLNRRIIKSHASHNQNYRYVLHLVRDPVDVMVSYKNYWLSHWGKDIGFSKLIRSWRGVPRWIRHTESWINSEVNQRYIPVHYQLLVESPEKVLKYIYRCYGVNVSDEAIGDAIIKSTMIKMRASETLWSYGHRAAFNDTEFVGVKKFRKESVSEADLRYIYQKTSTLHQSMLDMCRATLND